MEELTMASAIAKANRNNPALYGRRLQQELYEINYEDAWARMYMPSINLTSTLYSPYTIAQMPGSPDAGMGGAARQHGFQSAGVALNLGQYTVFNWGRDKDAYHIAELEVERSRESIHEVERDVRYRVIQSMFNFKTQADLVDAAQRTVDSAEAVHELVRSRIASGRASRADLASVSIDLLNARNILIQNQNAYNRALWDLNVVLGDPVGHRYRVKTEVRFIKFRMPLDEVLALFRDNSPAIKDARKALEQSRAELRIAEKNRLPLPTIAFSGVTLGWNFFPNGTQPNRSDSQQIPPILNNAAVGNYPPQNGNFNIGAQLQFSIPLTGDGGFLGERKLRAAEINVDLAELNLRNAANLSEALAQDLYSQIIQIETTVDYNQRIFKQASEVFEASLATLQTRGTLNRLDIKNALEQLLTSETNLTSSVLNHYNLKLQLASLIGVDRFPEENL
jgi:outer membrane protein TolC